MLLARIKRAFKVIVVTRLQPVSVLGPRLNAHTRTTYHTARETAPRQLLRSRRTRAYMRILGEQQTNICDCDSMYLTENKKSYQGN